VEHPVTEEITGVDLVEWQLRVASGEALPLKQDEIKIIGHAIEARLYAEDPKKGFLPSTGTLEHFSLPFELARIDTGVQRDAEITPYYDPMVSKIIAHAATREDALEALREAVARIEIWPVRTNAAFLFKLLGMEGFRSGNVDTGLIGRELEGLISIEPVSISLFKDAMNALILSNEDLSGSLGGSLSKLAGFRLNARTRYCEGVYVDGSFVKDFADNHIYHTSAVTTGGNRSAGFQDGQATELMLDYRGAGHTSAHDGDILSPMPGKVIAVDVAAGDAVTAGQRLLVLEAMKMEHALTAPFDGTVSELNASEGAQVQVEVLLVRIEKAEAD
jgi:3-methylcrotonyl-CoA carboxylase alpha subunit